MENSTTAAGATSTLSEIDRQCHELSRQAFLCADVATYCAHMIVADGPLDRQNKVDYFVSRTAALANRIIALRTAEAAQVTP
jgi:hypothetical protein